MVEGSPVEGPPPEDSAGTGSTTGPTTGSAPRFLPLTDVAEVLNISAAQVYALVRRGDLPAIKIGGRGQWRVESVQLEAYIKNAYSSTQQFIKEHPFVGDDDRVDPAGEAAQPGSGTPD